MSKLKLWKSFSLFMVLLLMSSLVAVVPAPVQANVSGITVTPYDTRIIGLGTGYRITMTTGASLNTGDSITIVFPAGTTVPDFSTAPEKVFVQHTPCDVVGVSGQEVTVYIPAIAPIVPGQPFTVTFNKDCGIINPATSGSRTVVVWTTVDPKHVTSSSYEITAVKLYNGATFLHEYATITEAITAASTGNTITVPAGTYNENLSVNIPLILQGASSATVIVTAADPAVSVFNVTASSVNISGFTATGTTITGDQGYAGIKFGAGVANCNIHDNILSSNQYGILLIEPENTTTPGNNIFTSNAASSCGVSGIEMQHSYGNTFVNNIANSNKQGFKLDSARNNTFTGNTANSNTTTGFFLTRGDGIGSNDNTFTKNIANSNTSHGFRIDGSTGNTLTENTATSNGSDGIRLKVTGGGNPGASNNTILTGNNLSGNSIGIDIVDSGIDATTLTVSNNNITGNTSYGVYNAGTGTLNAKHNYWNNASGPSHLSPVAYGDNVTANVTFQPWLVNTSTETPPAGEIAITTASPLPDGNTGYAYSTPLSATGGSGTYTWARYSGTVPPGLSFTGSNFSGTPTQVNADPGFNFFVKVSDGIQATSENFTMKVYGGALVITTMSPLPGGTKNVPYGPETLHAIGGTGIYTWSLNVGSGPLPTGLGLASDGKITGTPTAADTFPFNVKVECGGSTPGYKDLSITISAAPVGGQKLIGAAADSTFTNVASGGYFALSQFTADASGDITQIRVKCASSGSIKVAIYSDNISQPNTPGTLLNAVNTPTAVTAGWYTIDFPSTHVDAGTKYWLARNSDGSMLYWKAQTGYQFRYRAATFSGFNFPATATALGALSTEPNTYHLMAGWAAVTVTAPTVTNSPVSNETQTSATLNGEVTATGNENPTVIIYWGDNDGGQTANWDYNVNLGTKDAVPFSTNITGLSASTLYYYTCFAANSCGNAWATPSASFTTLALGAPTVTNSTGARIVTATSARLNGAITDTGGVNPTVIIYWGDNDGQNSSSNWDNSVPLGTKGKEAFYTDITDLTRGTKYYYRSFASNSSGPAWAASSENFTTLSGGYQKIIGAAADSTFTNVATGGYFALAQFTAESSGDITELRVKCASSGYIKLAIYSDISGEPGNLLPGAFTASTHVDAGWNTITFPSTHVDAGTKYWLARNSDGNMLYWKAQPGSPFRYKAAAFSSSFPSIAGTGFGSDQLYHLVAGWGTFTLPAPPVPPAIVTPKTTITFGWTSSGATKYRLQVNTASDFTGTSMFDNEVSTNSQAVTLSVGTTYYWRVKAGNTGGWSGWSSTGSVTP